MESKKLQILLLEDNEADVMMFERMLDKGFSEPFEIIHAKTFMEGQQYFSSCDIIVSDLGLPDSKGAEAVLKIYSLVPQTPLLVLSGNQDFKIFRQVIESGAHDYLIKGVISSEALCRCILSAIIRKKTELKLIQASENKSRYVAQMSHEIRTPLNVLLGFLELLISENKNHDLDQYMSLMDRTGNTIKELLDDILDLSKIEAGKLELDEAAFDLHLLLITALDIFKTKAISKGVELKLNLQTNVPRFVVGDSHKLRQVIFNLLSNAIKFTSKGTVMFSIKSDEKTDTINFEVEDSGRGINPLLLDKLFTPYEQGGVATTQEFGGTGLGLAISKNLVLLMKGQISAKNRNEGGAIFSFHLPFKQVINDNYGANSPIDTYKGLSNIALTGKRILIADDSEDSLLLYRAFLKKSECLLDTTGNGKSAVELYKKNHYDIVILDYQMPVMNGLDTIAEIRKYEREQKLKSANLILLTGDSSSDVQDKFKYSEASHFLMKPIKWNSFISAILEHEK